MSDLQKRLQLSRLPPLPQMPPSTSGASGSKRGHGMLRRRDYTPVQWNEYFETARDIQVDTNTFRLYQCGTEGPICFFLHGGGFSALSWAVLSKTLCGLMKCRCAAVDLRGHGDTKTTDEKDLSAETLARDVGQIVQAVYGDEVPPIILVGHSMGGAIAVHVGIQNLISSLIGLAVIDVVEGTALDALGSMQTFLRGRPSRFKSLEHAIEWCVRTGQIRNIESAKVSMAGQLKKLDSNEAATQDNDVQSAAEVNSGVIQEEEESEQQDMSPKKTKTDSEDSKESKMFKVPEQPGTSEQLYTWRIDLSETEPFWRGWFENLSKNFLSVNVPKLLLLAGVDRLDRELTVGQMQGKFQMQVLPQSGHAVHEDVPDKVADILATFMVRHKMAKEAANFQRAFPAC